MDWWLSITVAGGTHCWPLGDPDDATREDLIARALLQTGVRAADVAPPAAGVRVVLAPGEPHPRTLTQCTVHQLAELAAVDAAAVAAFQAERAAATRATCFDGARRAAAQLPAEDRRRLAEELLASPRTTARGES